MHIKERGPRDGGIHRLAFLDISLPLLHDYDVKLLSFTFYEGREHKTTIFFSFSEFRYNPLQSTYEKFPNIKQIIFNGITALNKV